MKGVADVVPAMTVTSPAVPKLEARIRDLEAAVATLTDGLYAHGLHSETCGGDVLDECSCPLRPLYDLGAKMRGGR